MVKYGQQGTDSVSHEEFPNYVDIKLGEEIMRYTFSEIIKRN